VPFLRFNGSMPRPRSRSIYCAFTEQSSSSGGPGHAGIHATRETVKTEPESEQKQNHRYYTVCTVCTYISSNGVKRKAKQSKAIRHTASLTPSSLSFPTMIRGYFILFYYCYFVQRYIGTAVHFEQAGRQACPLGR